MTLRYGGLCKGTTVGRVREAVARIYEISKVIAGGQVGQTEAVVERADCRDWLIRRLTACDAARQDSRKALHRGVVVASVIIGDVFTLGGAQCDRSALGPAGNG